jgi:hypothetical protein
MTGMAFEWKLGPMAILCHGANRKGHGICEIMMPILTP